MPAVWHLAGLLTKKNHIKMFKSTVLGRYITSLKQ
jgi:hypothetical protein